MPKKPTLVAQVKDPATQVPFVLTKKLRHLALVMDGNGRWAEARGLSRSKGHEEGTRRVQDILDESIRLGIEVLSVYAFSTENWSRPKQEIQFLFSNLERFLIKEQKQVHKKQIKIMVSGELEPLPKSLKQHIQKTVQSTAHYSKFTLNVCLNYSGQEEILMAAKAFARDMTQHPAQIEKATKQDFERYLYTRDLPPVDLMIRTSGEYRISNFLLYQLAYAEFVFTPVYWPDFRIEAFHDCLRAYENRNRRFGGLKDGSK